MGREVGPQPLFLGRTGGHADVAVDDDDVPASGVIAVVALGAAARGRAEVAVIAARAARVVVVIARRRPGAAFVAAPGRVVALAELSRRSTAVRIVAKGDNHALQAVEQLGGSFVAIRRA